VLSLGASDRSWFSFIESATSSTVAFFETNGVQMTETSIVEIEVVLEK